MEAFGEVASGLAVGLASGTRGVPRKMVRRGFEKVFRRASGRLRKGSEGVFWAGLSRKDFRRGSFGEVISVGLGIDGWGSSMRLDRGELRSDQPKCLGDASRWILDLWLGLVGQFGPAERLSDS